MTSLPIPSEKEPMIDRFRRPSSRWWPWFKRMFESLKTVESSVLTVNTEIDQINSSYTVSINGSGHVVGLTQLKSDPLGFSTFTVVADKFVVANPTNGTDVREFFVTGQVDGVETVGIAGNLIVDGTIEAEALNVGTLSAITADVGTVTAGIIKSADDKMTINLNAGTITIVA